MRSISIWRLVFIVLYVLGCSTSAMGVDFPPDTVYSSRITDKLKIDTIMLLETSCSECGLEDIINRNEDFERTPAGSFRSDPSKTYWIRQVIVNDVDSAARIYISNGWNESVTAYFFAGRNPRPQISRTGGLIPASEREISFSSSTLDFNLPPQGDTATIFLRIQNAHTTYPPNLSFSILSESAFDAYLDRIRVRDNISIAFQGAVGVMLLFMLLIYLQNRDKVYLFYSLYMAGIMIYLSSTMWSNIYVNYLFKEFPILEVYFNFPVQLLFYIAYNKFVDSFLDLKKNDPWLHKKILQLNLTFLAILIATLAYQIITSDALTVATAWTGISTLMIVAYLLLLYRLITFVKTPAARFIITGMVIFMIAAVICMVLVNFVRPRILMTISPYNILEMGLFLEILCFSMGLGYKMWQTNMEKQRMQEAYIGELQRNEVIIQEANVQLEQKVKERTAEVIRKNKEIGEERKKQMASEYERKLAMAEMSALRAQMNPHFMFNSMNTLEAFILEKQEKEASHFLNKFSKLLRLVLENSRQLLVSVEKDIEALELYIQLEQIRYDHRFTYTIDVDPGLLEEDLSIPPLIIQPFVENAIVHGLFNKTGQGKLEIAVQLSENKIHCRIEDDGIGREMAQEIRRKNKPHHKSLGLKVTSERIETLNQIHGANARVETIDLVDTEGNPAGTKVEIYLPLL